MWVSNTDAELTPFMNQPSQLKAGVSLYAEMFSTLPSVGFSSDYFALEPV